MLLNLIFYCLFLEKTSHDLFRRSWPESELRTKKQHNTQHIERGDALRWVRDSWKISRIVPHTTQQFQSITCEWGLKKLPPSRLKRRELNLKESNSMHLVIYREIYTLERHADNKLRVTKWRWHATHVQCSMLILLDASVVWSQHLFTSYQVNALGRN